MRHTRSVRSLAGRLHRDWALETFRQTSPHFRKMPKLERRNCRKTLTQEPVLFLIPFLQRAFLLFVQITTLRHPGKHLHLMLRAISRRSHSLIADTDFPLFRRYCHFWIPADTFFQPSRTSRRSCFSRWRMNSRVDQAAIIFGLWSSILLQKWNWATSTKVCLKFMNKLGLSEFGRKFLCWARTYLLLNETGSLCSVGLTVLRGSVSQQG
jgi:hypothetical protein